MSRAPHQQVLAVRAVGAVALWGLMLLQPTWHAWLRPPAPLPLGLVLSVAMLPLVVPLWLWLHAPRRGLLLGGIIGLLYFCHGLMEAWADPGARILGLVEAGLVVLLIAALGLIARIEKRAAANSSDSVG